MRTNVVRPIIAPSILNCDFTNLLFECNRLLEAGSDCLHLDVMDCHFVPNLSFGFPIIKCLKEKLPNIFFESHAMISEPAKWVHEFVKCGSDLLTFHYECFENNHEKLYEIIKNIKNWKMQVGIAIKPKTEVAPILETLINESLIDNFLVMTVEPGFGGQSFMSDMMSKTKYLRNKFPNLAIQIDGGVSLEVIDKIKDGGVNCLVVGTSLVKDKNPKLLIDQLREKLSS